MAYALAALLFGGAGLAALITQGREDFKRFEAACADEDDAWTRDTLVPVAPKLSRDDRN